jgi:xylulokinase
MSLILAIDLGTSGPKVALYTATGELLAGASAPTPLIFTPDGGVEQSPAAWWEAICTATQRVLAMVSGAAARVTGVGVTTQWSGTVPLGADGKPLGNAIIWMDARGARHIRQVTGGFPAFSGYGARKLWTWLRKTGGIPGHSGKDSIAHILYLRHAQPDRYAKTATFLEPKDYINYKLTGRIASTGETMTLHWVTDNRAIDQIHYDDELLRLAGLDRASLPADLLHSVDVLGTLTPAAAADLGLNDAGQGGGRRARHSHRRGRLRRGGDFAAHCYIGTSSWLSCHVPFKQTDIRAQHGRAAVGAARALSADQRTRDRRRRAELSARPRLFRR